MAHAAEAAPVRRIAVVETGCAEVDGVEFAVVDFGFMACLFEEVVAC